MNNVLRAFAFGLVLTGAVASAHMTNTPAQTTVTAKTSVMPIPMCDPSDPNGCGIKQLSR